MDAEQADIGGVAGTEIQSRFGADELGQFATPILPRLRRCRKAAGSRWNRRRLPCAKAAATACLQSRIGGETQIIVGAEIDSAQDFQTAATAMRLESGKFLLQAPEHRAS